MALIYTCSLFSYFSHLSCMSVPPPLFQLFPTLAVYQLYCQDAFREHNLFLMHDFLTGWFVFMFVENFKMTVTLGQGIKSCEAVACGALLSRFLTCGIASGVFISLLMKCTLVHASVQFPFYQESTRSSQKSYDLPVCCSPNSQHCRVPLECAKIMLQANIRGLKGSLSLASSGGPQTRCSFRSNHL